MDKYILRQEFSDCQIITKTDDGTEVMITKNNFSDYFGEMLFKNGQHHLIKINPQYNESEHSEKKSFKQISENVILLTSTPEQTGRIEPLPIVNEPELKQNAGKPQKRRK